VLVEGVDHKGSGPVHGGRVDGKYHNTESGVCMETMLADKGLFRLVVRLWRRGVGELSQATHLGRRRGSQMPVRVRLLPR
jgi:hypothetical protein